MSKGKGGNVASAVFGIAKPVAESLGLKIWDVRFLKEGADWFLRIFIDKEGGVSLEDCEKFSRALDGPLDELDPIETSYRLEISSPGIERELARDAHFKACAGKKIKVKLIRAVDGTREFRGTLESYDSGVATLSLDDGSPFVFEKKEASSVKLDDFGA